MGDNNPVSVVDRITADGFADWYAEQQVAQNIREGKPYFNGPARVPDPERHSPSQLLQCHRKIVYRQENAPKESEDPEGIFLIGELFETDVIVPYLQDVVADAQETYVRNSMWVDEIIDVDDQEIRIKGATDPVIVTRESEPLVVTEIKSKNSLDGVSSPNRHHRAQLHAYMHGLSEAEKYEQDVDQGILIYGDRTTLDIAVFHVPFDDDFWGEVLDWAATHTAFREEDELPPSDPEYNWECQFCSYKHRCGQSDRPYSDFDADGFLPLFSGYPREQVMDYMDAHEETALTPSLAFEYPELADEWPVLGWECPECATTYGWDTVDWNGDTSHPPLCSLCAENDDLPSLKVRNQSNNH